MWPPTLATSAELRARLVDAYAPDEEVPPMARVRARCCGAVVPAAAVRVLAGVPDTTCKPGGRRARRDLDEACDGCFELVIADRSNGWTRSKLARAQGAPAEAIRELRAMELRDEACTRAGEKGASPLAELERARAALPVGRRDLPGTEPPGRPRD